MKRSTVFALMALPALLGSLSLQAATQGVLSVGSGGSSGDFQVDFVVPPLVRVTIEDDVTLTFADLSSDATGVGAFCVYSNQGTSAVDIEITFDNDDGANTYLLGGTSSDELEYTVDYNVYAGSVIAAALAPTGYLDDESALAQNTQNCGGSWSHELVFTVAAADYAAVTADTYTDIVYLEVTVD